MNPTNQTLQDRDLKQFLADFQREVRRYPLVDKDEVPLEALVRRPSATARRDPLNPMYFALKKVNLL